MGRINLDERQLFVEVLWDPESKKVVMNKAYAESFEFKNELAVNGFVQINGFHVDRTLLELLKDMLQCPLLSKNSEEGEEIVPCNRVFGVIDELMKIKFVDGAVYLSYLY